ncbi:hypothetical protein Sjap_007619 [Stephania japonica]|uniref:Uncharacterized protein n=1 Tax=Stephania japonica TaxID=461633 RepID=A0AAP0JQ63_9MAGN
MDYVNIGPILVKKLASSIVESSLPITTNSLFLNMGAGEARVEGGGELAAWGMDVGRGKGCSVPSKDATE